MLPFRIRAVAWRICLGSLGIILLLSLAIFRIAPVSLAAAPAQQSVGAEATPIPPRAGAAANAVPAAGPSSLGWQRIAGIDGEVRWLAVLFFDPRIVVAGVDGVGVYRSDDAGVTWTLLPTGGLTDKSIQTVAFCPAGRLFAGTWGGGVFRFDQTGWTAVNLGLPQRFIAALTCDFNGIVMAGTYNRGIFRSPNFGGIWGPANNGLGSLNILGLNSVPGLTGVGTANGGYSTTDSGTTWRYVGLSGNAIYDFAFDRYGAGRIWAAAKPGGVHVSTDQGISWAPQGGPSDVYTVQHGADNYLYAGTQGHGVSRLAGTVWADDGLPVTRVYLLRLAAEGRLIAGTSDGIWVAQALQPTATPPPSPTPTPTPAPVVQITLRDQAPEPLNVGDEITYLVDYEVVGGASVTSVVITNAVPSGVNLVADSIAPPQLGSEAGGIVTWQLGDLSADAAGTVSYRVRLSEPAASPTATPTNTPEPPTATPMSPALRQPAYLPMPLHTPVLSARAAPRTVNDAIIIFNAGAYVYWDHAGQRLQGRSNAVLTGATQRIYLPLIQR